MTNRKKELTKSEEQVMQYLWKIEKGFVKDIVELFPDPRPAYTTVTTVIRILVKKGYIGFNTYGKVHEYFPLVSKKEYIGKHIKKVVKNYFNGSVGKFTSFFTEDNDLSLTELEEMKKLIETRIKKRNPDD